MSDPVLTYDVPPPAGPPVAVMCGIPAVLFAVTVLVATVAENHGYVRWQGLPVVGPWVCLLAGPVLGIVAVLSGVRAARRRAGDRRVPIVGAVAGAVALLGFVGWIMYVAGFTRF